MGKKSLRKSEMTSCGLQDRKKYDDDENNNNNNNFLEFITVQMKSVMSEHGDQILWNA